MRGESVLTCSRLWICSIPSLRRAVHLLLCFIFITLATAFAGFYGQNHAPGDLLWISNGLLLAYMLQARSERWNSYLITGFVALFCGDILIHESWTLSLMFSTLNLAEVLIATLLMRWRGEEKPRFTDPVYLLRFIGFAVLAAPIMMGAVFAFLLSSWLHVSPLHAFGGWVGPDCLGIATITPTCVAIFQSNWEKCYWWRTGSFYLALSAAVALGSFGQNSVPVALLLYPLLVLIALRTNLGCAALSMLLTAIMGSYFTAHGMGPFATAGSGDSISPSIHLQLHVAVGIFILYSISVVRERQSATERQLRKIVSLNKLVTENSRDIIILSDFNGRRSYVSGDEGSMGGWTREELMQQGSFALVHPDDLAETRAVVESLRSGVEAAMFECRARQRDGSYVWIEANLCVVRDPATGVPSGILNITRNISERKQAEQRLQEAYNTVETLAITDGLTGLANRRQFDRCFANEWRRGIRDGLPLSLLMIDADYFKLYNDTYGHVRGDYCLKQIAEVCRSVVTRPGDLVARFGGEEFVIILPNTDNEGAMQVANEVCLMLRRRKMPYDSNLPGIVTISVGCATMVPQMGMRAGELIEMADRALYRAKRNGRNQVCNGNLRGKNELNMQAPIFPGVMNSSIA